MKLKWILCASLLLALSGCALGRGPLGEVVVGADLGKLTETNDQIIGGLVEGWAPGWGAALAGLGIPGLIALGVRRVVRKSETKRKHADQKREVAERDVAVLTERARSVEVTP